MKLVDNNKEKLSKAETDIENQRLRGDRVRQISNDMKNFDGTDREKMLKYSEHLSWCLKTFERIYKLQINSAKAANKSAYAHGLANGVIGAMAVIMEEQGDAPYIKPPEKYETTDQEFADQVVVNYVSQLEQALGQIMLMDENGPEGYAEDDNPILSWILDTVKSMEKSPIQTAELKSFRKNLLKQIRTNLETNSE